MPVTPIQRQEADAAREALIARLRAQAMTEAERKEIARAGRYRRRLLEKAAYEAMRDLNLIDEG